MESDSARALLEGPFGAVMAGVFGALWGSFFNVCIARVPRRQSVVSPGSHCFACRAPVRARDNIPIVSSFLLRGRCRDCGAVFSVRYAAVEALTAALGALLYWYFVVRDPAFAMGLRLARFALGFAFTGVLVVLSFIDLDTKRLPDRITLPSIPIFFLAGFGTGDVPWLDRLLGAAVGYLAVRLIADGYYYITGREGLGLGDGKLLAVIGVVLGWRALPLVIFAAAFVGILVSVPILFWQHRRAKGQDPGQPAADGASTAQAGVPSTVEAGVPSTAEAEALPAATSIRRTEVPFGPFLAASALVYLFVGEAAWDWFLGFLLPG